MNILRLRAFAKLNLALFVFPREGDHHPIASAMQSVSLHDELTFQAGPGNTRVNYHEPYPIPLKENLVWKTLRFVREKYAVTEGMSVWLRKRIPIGSGMGGGSADAAATLVAANRLWGLELPDAELQALASQVGSDVPFCLQGGTQWVEGRGEKISPLPTLEKIWFVMFCPGFPISTKEAYGWWDESGNQSSNGRAQLRELLGESDHAGSMQYWKNDFYTVLSSRHPEYTPWVERLKRSGAEIVSLTGSGSALFGAYQGEAEARRAAAEIADDGAGEAFVVRPVRRGIQEADA